MDEPTLEQRAADLRRFFKFRSAAAWAKEAAPDLATADVPESYRQTQRLKRREAELLVMELAAANQLALVESLVAGARQELLLAVCRVLQKQPWPEAVPAVAREFIRQPNDMVRAAILDVIAAGGSADNLGVVRLGLRSGTSQLKETAERAVNALAEREPVVAWLLQAETASPPPAPVPVAETLLSAYNVPNAISFVATLADRNAFAAEALRRELVQVAAQPDGAGEYATLRTSARLVLAGLGGPLDDETAKAVRRAVLGIGPESRDQLLQAAHPAAAADLVKTCLSATQARTVNQGLDYVVKSRPDLLPELSAFLTRLSAHADADIARRALTLLNRVSPTTVDTGDQDVRFQRLLNHSLPLGPAARFGPLFGSEVGRTVLADAALTPDQWQQLTDWVRTAPLPAGLNETYAELARALDGDPANLDRLVWLIGQSDLVDQKTVSRALPAIERSVAAETLFGSDARFGRVYGALETAPDLWAALARRVLVKAAGADSDRVKQLLNLLPAGGDTLAILPELLQACEVYWSQILEAMAALKGDALTAAQHWLNGPGHTYADMMQGVLRRTQVELVEAARSVDATWEEEWRNQADGVNALLQELDSILEPNMQTTPELTGPLRTIFDELGRAVFDREAPGATALPRPVSPSGNALLDYHEARLVRHATAQLLHEQQQALRQEIGAQAAPAVEALLVLLHGTPAAGDAAGPLATWLAGLGLTVIEPVLGQLTRFAPERHQATSPVKPGTSVTVVAWGVAAESGRILRKALVTQN